MRFFKLFNAERLAAPAYNESKMYAVQIKGMEPGLKMP